MSEDIQSLLDRINAEGVEKGEAEGAAIVAKAKEESSRILADARAEADAIAKEGAERAEASEKRAEETIRQAARDIVIALKSDLLSKLSAVTRECVSSSLTPELMGNILMEMAKGYASNADADELQVILSKKDQDNAEAVL